MKKVFVDIGNSRIKIKSGDTITGYDFVNSIENSLFSKDNVWIISSVNRGVKEELTATLDAKEIEYCVVDRDILAKKELGFSIDFKEFSTIGVDRVLDSVTGVKICGYSTLVIDLGTANTYNFIDENGVFKGGVITPGLNTRLYSLKSNTSDLPAVFMDNRPFGVVHSNTNLAIKSGVYYGLLGELKEIITMIRAKNVIFTGGCSGFYFNFIQESDFFVRENLILEALEQIF